MDNFNYREFIYGQSLFNGKEDDKQQLNESAPGYDNRKFGEALPTLESVKAAHEAKEKEEINEGDLFSSKFDRPHLKDIIRDLNEQPIFDMAVRRAYKFLVSLLDAEDKEELGLNEDIEEIVKENLKDKAKEALRKIQTVAKEKGQNVKSFLKDADGMEVMSALFPGLTAASSFMEEEKNDKL